MRDPKTLHFSLSTCSSSSSSYLLELNCSDLLLTAPYLDSSAKGCSNLQFKQPTSHLRWELHRLLYRVDITNLQRFVEDRQKRPHLFLHARRRQSRQKETYWADTLPLQQFFFLSRAKRCSRVFHICSSSTPDREQFACRFWSRRLRIASSLYMELRSSAHLSSYLLISGGTDWAENNKPSIVRRQQQVSPLAGDCMVSFCSR